ncbi:MAG: hypothetical protein CFE40_05510 [Burkholderiales bacterium PBB1]|nr:MAG: hypothetical protein CFE40_05510 [Burkholderiales bacterium PBB1]
MKKQAREEFTRDQLNAIFADWTGATVRIRRPERETVHAAAHVYATERGVSWVDTSYAELLLDEPFYETHDGLFERAGEGFLFRDRYGGIIALNEHSAVDEKKVGDALNWFADWLKAEGRTWREERERLHRLALEAIDELKARDPDYASYERDRLAFVKKVSKDLPKVLSRVGRERLAGFAFFVKNRSSDSVTPSTDHHRQIEAIRDASDHLMRKVRSLQREPAAGYYLLTIEPDVESVKSSLDALNAHLKRVVTDRYPRRPKGGREKAFWPRYLAICAWREFGAEELPTGHTNELLDTCKTLCANAGLESESEVEIIKELKSQEENAGKIDPVPK